MKVVDNELVVMTDKKNFLSDKTYLVGLTLAEYLPWSAKQMFDLMKSTNIF